MWGNVVDVLQHLGAVRLQAAVHVVQTDAGDERRRSVVDPGDDAAAERIAPVLLPAGDEVIALVELREEVRDLGGVVLEVGVDRHDHVAGGDLEAGCQRRDLAEPPPQSHDPDVRVRLVQPHELAI